MSTYQALTQQQKILTIMARDINRVWFLPQDFMQSGLGELFVGYEASARLSELAKQYPDMIESRRNGKYMARRLRTENIDDLMFIIPAEFREIFERYNVRSAIQQTLI